MTLPWQLREFRDRRQIAKKLLSIGFAEQAELMPRMPTPEEARELNQARWRIVPAGKNAALYHSLEDGQLHCLVAQKSDDRITGTCIGYRNNRAGICIHGVDFCQERGLPIPPGAPMGVRRLPPRVLVCPGDHSQRTKQNKAYRTMKTRVRELAFSLCRYIKCPLRPRSSVRRRNPVPLGVLLYCLLYRFAYGSSYEDAWNDLKGDPFLKEMGWKFPDPPHWNKWCDALGEEVTKFMGAVFIKRTSNVGLEMDYAAAADASGFGMTRVANWNEEKPAENNAETIPDSEETADGTVWDRTEKRGKTMEIDSDDLAEDNKTKSARKKRKRFLKMHPIMGTTSKLIYAVNVTLDHGEGTHDQLQFEDLLLKVSRRLGKLRIVLLDRGYWAYRNFKLAKELGLLLMVVPRAGNVMGHVRGGRELLEFIMWVRRRHPAVYRRFSRLRQVVESLFQSAKSKSGHIRSKRRARDEERLRAFKDPRPIGKGAPLGIRVMRKKLCSMIAREAVPIALHNDAVFKAVGSNLRAIARLEARYRVDTVDFKPLQRVPRVSLPEGL